MITPSLQNMYVVCFFVSLVFFAIAIVLFVKDVILGSKKSSSEAKNRMLVIIILLGLSCWIAVAPIGVNEALFPNVDSSIELSTEPPASMLIGFFLSLYDCLSMLLFESRLDTFYSYLYKTIDPDFLMNAEGYLAYISFLYVAAPLTIAATAVSMFQGRLELLSSIRKAKKKEASVVCVGSRQRIMRPAALLSLPSFALRGAQVAAA